MLRNRCSWALAAAVMAGTMMVPTPARAGIEACFEGSHDFAVCNGFLAVLGGLGGMALPIVALTDPESYGAGSVAAGVAMGIYAGASGGALVASSQAQEPGSTLRDTGLALGVTSLVAGGGALVLSTVAGVTLALHGDDDDDDEDEEGMSFAVGPAVPALDGAAPGLMVTGRF